MKNDYEKTVYKSNRFEIIEKGYKGRTYYTILVDGGWNKAYTLHDAVQYCKFMLEKYYR